MVTRSFKLASISFLTFSLLLGAHQHRLHAHDHNSSVSQAESLHKLNTGPETFYQTNPFGMPGADTKSLDSTSLNGQAAAYGITPPTAWGHPTFQAQSVQPTKTNAKTRTWYTYFGLLGLLGLLGLRNRNTSTYSN